ncbi:hypothetical protein PENTCL1PPCAC_19458, partial [Pristionchus entomophagus]
QNGVYLSCSCGVEIRSYNPNQIHNKKCDGAEFTLHKLSAPTTPKCVLCEVYPTTAYGYTQHLKAHHKSTRMKSTWFVRAVRK